MTPADKIDITLRAAILAKDVLELVSPVNKLHAQLMVKQIVKDLKPLIDKIESLPED